MKVNYQKMLDTYNQINKVLNDIIDNSNDVKKTISTLSSSEVWKGKSSTAFRTKTNELLLNLNSYIAEVKYLNSAINTSVQKYQAVDKQIMSSLGGS